MGLALCLSARCGLSGLATASGFAGLVSPGHSRSFTLVPARTQKAGNHAKDGAPKGSYRDDQSDIVKTHDVGSLNKDRLAVGGLASGGKP